MKNHTFMLDWLCKQPGEEIKKIENNSVYIDEDGHLHYTPIEGTPVRLDNEQAQQKGQQGLKIATHPAFTLKSQDKTDLPETVQEALDLPPVVRSENKPRIGAKLPGITPKTKPKQQSKMLEEATAPPSNLQGDQERKTETRPVQGIKSPNRAKTGRCQPDKTSENKSLYYIRRLYQNDDHLSLAPVPDLSLIHI